MKKMVQDQRFLGVDFFTKLKNKALLPYQKVSDETYNYVRLVCAVYISISRFSCSVNNLINNNKKRD